MRFTNSLGKFTIPSEFYFTLFASLFVSMILFSIYKVNFSKYLHSRENIEKIVQLKIDSCKRESFSRYVNYEFYVGKKYLISVDSAKFQPFQSERADFYVKDFYGNYIVSDFRTWDSDRDKLMKYLREYLSKK